MLVWVRFLSLNMVYYDESFLMGLALVFGKPIKVDLNTLNAEYRRFARVYVEVNLNKSKMEPRAKMLKFPKVGSTSSATKENDMAIDQVALVPNRDHPSEMIDASEVDPRPRQ
ncbi:hypothetical protein JHK87_004348 [Glycine soja]|nr:hypothetical protein JHK87_004348 [Glycine soja]